MLSPLLTTSPFFDAGIDIDCRTFRVPLLADHHVYLVNIFRIQSVVFLQEIVFWNEVAPAVVKKSIESS